MSDDDTISPGDGGKLIAAEYVLGVLGAEERREVERRLPGEPALAAEVAVATSACRRRTSVAETKSNSVRNRRRCCAMMAREAAFTADEEASGGTKAAA